MTKFPSPIVVGIDAAPDCSAAVRWAIADASASHRPVRLVYAYPSLEVGGTEQNIVSAPELTPDTAQEHAQRFLDQTLARLDLPANDVAIETAAVPGPATEALGRESESAALLVLGSRKLGPAGSYLFGSVGQEVASRAHCPTVLVRAEPDPSLPPEIVVGLGTGGSAEQVLAFAFEQASWRGAALRVVHGWRSPLGPRSTIFPVEFSAPDIDELSREAAEIEVSEVLAGWREKFPDVPVTSVVRYGHPATLLVEQSAGKLLLVVGNSAHRPLAGLLFGSVSQAVLHHAACPVAVVPLS